MAAMVDRCVRCMCFRLPVLSDGPPAHSTAFAAAAIARSPPMVTGLNAWKIAKGLYVMPLLFAYTPLVSGSLDQALLVFAFALGFGTTVAEPALIAVTREEPGQPPIPQLLRRQAIPRRLLAVDEEPLRC